ncbi:MAG: cupin domain-containing protein [Francisellaceae bacterium]|nr:cupin domain-containing protein [Francisellaceae bacterium]
MPGFKNPLSAEELAGLSLENEIESRLVINTPDETPNWHLKNGPFTEEDYQKLPESHWTLLVQGVDKLIPEVTNILDHFDFIPQWRLDDIMVSYATEQGSVGPHYDNYDVFLYQGKGQRKWSLTSKNCNPDNYFDNVALRIMENFDVEEEYILEEGDMLYLPPHIGHHGVSLSTDCITYSIGYRSYQNLEMWDDFGEYLFANKNKETIYKDPNWMKIKNTSELPSQAIANAKSTLLDILNNEDTVNNWFGCFSTKLDLTAESQLPLPILESEMPEQDEFVEKLKQTEFLQRNPICRFVYQLNDDKTACNLFINGQPWDCDGVSLELVMMIANQRKVSYKQLIAHLDDNYNVRFLLDMWQLGWVEY